MVKNKFGWNLFKGKVYQNIPPDKIIIRRVENKYWLAFRNDLSAIAFTNKEQLYIQGFRNEFEWDSVSANALLTLATRACYEDINNVTNKQIADFMMYVLLANEKETPLCSLKTVLETKTIQPIEYKRNAKAVRINNPLY